jgi:hypothetical protein
MRGSCELSDQADRSSVDRLFAPSSARCGGSEANFAGSLTVEAVRLQSQNKKTTVTMPSENQLNNNISSQCILIPFAMPEHLR